MPQDIFVVDAFSAEPFAGNPAAVCILDAPQSDEWMQSVAAEMNLSETAFLCCQQDGVWQLRWFTPKVEVALCGHATLASAHVLRHERGEQSEVLAFDTRSGRLTAKRVGESIELDFPRVRSEPVLAPSGLNEALGIKEGVTYRAGSDLLVCLESAADVVRLAPDFSRLVNVDARGVIVTASSDDATCDFVSRFFAPTVGVDEDPVTGSAHCALAPFWGERLGRRGMRGYQASARGGMVEVELNGERVLLRGTAVTTLKGVLYV